MRFVQKSNTDLIRLCAALYISYDAETLEQNSLKIAFFNLLFSFHLSFHFFPFFSVSFVH